MNFNDYIIIAIAILSMYLMKDFFNKYILVLILATSSVGICITKDVTKSISIGLIVGSLYTLMFTKKTENYAEFKIQKETFGCSDDESLGV